MNVTYFLEFFADIFVLIQCLSFSCLKVELQPCDKAGNPYTNLQDVILRNPETQLKKLYFLVKLNTVRCMSPKYKVSFYNNTRLPNWLNWKLFCFKKDIYCEYVVLGDEAPLRTPQGGDTNNPDINYVRLVSYDAVNSEVWLLKS